MTNRPYRFLQALALIGLGFFLLEKLISGKLAWYIHQRFWPLSFLAGVGLLLMGQIALGAIRRRPESTQPHADEEHEHEHGEHEHSHADHEHASAGWGWLVMLLPLAVGWLLPARPLDTVALDNKGLSLTAPLAAGQSAPAARMAPGKMNILDWIQLFNSGEDLAAYIGQEANVIGFVYHDPRLEQDQFMVSRFAIVCCAADAFAIGITVDSPEADSLPKDSWVQVKGNMQSITKDGEPLPFIRATSVKIISQPEQPYLFP